MKTQFQNNPFRSPRFWYGAALLALVVWTVYCHVTWSQTVSPIHGLVGFFIGLFVLILLQGMARLVVSVLRHGFRWIVSGSALRIAAWSVVFAVSTLVLFYSIELWRGKRAWSRVVVLSNETGETLNLQQIVPGPVADSENFASAPIFSHLYAPPTPGRNPGLGDWAHIGYWEKWPLLKIKELRECPWLDQQPTDFRPWLDFWRAWEPKPPVSKNEPRSDPFDDPFFPNSKPVPNLDRAAAAALTLEGLVPFQPQIEGARAASARPYCRFPLDYSRQMIDNNNASSALNGLTRIVRLRASAELAVGKADAALEDIRLALRLSQYAEQQQWPRTAKIRLAILADALQPVWEGLAGKSWTESQLAVLQKDLDSLNPLQAYPNALRMNAFALATFCEALVPTTATTRIQPSAEGIEAERTLAIIRMLYPVGWSLQDQAAIHKERFSRLRQHAPQKGWTQLQDWPGALWSSSDPFYPVFIVPQAIEMLRDDEHYYFTQAAVRLAVVGCAIERHRLTTGKLPESLKELAAGSTDSLLRDPLTTQPFHYTREGDYFTLYSIGFNGVDDMARSSPESHSRHDLPNRVDKGDIVWAYSRKAPRN